MLLIQAHHSIFELEQNHKDSLLWLQKKGVDYEYHSLQTLAELCESHALDIQTTLSELNSALLQKKLKKLQEQGLHESILANYENGLYGQQSLKKIRQILSSPKKDSEFNKQFRALFDKLEKAYSSLLEKKEVVFYPFIQKLLLAKEEKRSLPQAQQHVTDKLLKGVEEANRNFQKTYAQVKSLAETELKQLAHYDSLGLIEALLAFEQIAAYQNHIDETIIYPKSLMLEAQLRL
ncbi:MAG: hypothetical protein MI784_08185 [Cytophagales bacterium]|nr:hypothetical protein [Cytophagales bacterium]